MSLIVNVWYFSHGANCLPKFCSYLEWLLEKSAAKEPLLNSPDCHPRLLQFLCILGISFEYSYWAVPSDILIFSQPRLLIFVLM